MMLSKLHHGVDPLLLGGRELDRQVERLDGEQLETSSLQQLPEKARDLEILAVAGHGAALQQLGLLQPSSEEKTAGPQVPGQERGPATVKTGDQKGPNECHGRDRISCPAVSPAGPRPPEAPQVPYTVTIRVANSYKEPPIKLDEPSPSSARQYRLRIKAVRENT